MQLLSQPLRAPIEETVSEYKGREWKVKSARDISELACHHCAILADDAFAVFAKC
jgi:hypothetical protein